MFLLNILKQEFIYACHVFPLGNNLVILQPIQSVEVCLSRNDIALRTSRKPFNHQYHVRNRRN